jgi:hypothetical protein
MIVVKKLHPIHIELTLEDLDVLLDGLQSLAREIHANPTYTTPEKRYAITQTWARLGALDDLHVLITGEGDKAVKRYHVVPTDTTVTQTQPA